MSPITWVEVTSQKALEREVAAGNAVIVRRGSFTAYGSSRVTAYGSSQVTAYDSSRVTATGYVAVSDHGPNTKITGGSVITVPQPSTIAEWIDFYGVRTTGTKHRTVIVYKALNEDFTSAHNGFTYEPGSKPEAPDWDGGIAECGGGLHFSPTPHHALQFNPGATRFVACPVLLADIRPPQPADSYPEKVKASRVFRPVYEVDIDGKRI